MERAAAAGQTRSNGTRICPFGLPDAAFGFDPALLERREVDHRIHSALNYQIPAAHAAGCVLPASATPQPPEQ